MPVAFASIECMTDTDYATYFAQMEPEKRERVARFRLETDRRRSVLADHLARKLLADAARLAPEAVSLDNTPAGKPVPRDLPFFLSLSHSGEWAVAAVDTVPVGVDLQIPRPVSAALITRVCSPAEQAFVGDLPARFFRVWTFKEAVYKLHGGDRPFGAIDYASDTDRYEVCYETVGDALLCVVKKKESQG